MLLTEEEVTERISSPLNLLNRLRSLSNEADKRIPSLPPTADELVNNLDEKLAVSSIRSKAAGIISQTLDQLKDRIVEVEDPSKLSRVAESMSKIIANAEEKNKNEDKNPVQFIVYAPQVISEQHFDVIKAND